MTTAIKISATGQISGLNQADSITGMMYKNPVTYDDGLTHTAPDPFIVEYRGTYYCYATDEHGITVAASNDMVHWHYEGFAYTEKGRRNYWAPSIILLNGLFYMYCSTMPLEETDTHTEIMQVSVSADPLGSFEKQTELFTTFAIDSQVVMGDDGMLYLLYADNQEMGLSDARPGTSVMIDRLTTPLTREGHPHPLITPTMDEEIVSRDRFGDGRDWHTVEGATYFQYRDRAFITYSANSYEHEDYFVGYSKAMLPDRLEEMHIDRLSWQKQRNGGMFDPLLIRSKNVEGTGHNSLIKAPNQIDDWIVYHGRNVSDELHVGIEQRVMRIDPLYYAEGGLDTVGPTDSEEEMPLKPDLTVDFAKGLPQKWRLVSGTCDSITDAQGGAILVSVDGKFLVVSAMTRTFATYVGSVWARATRSPFGMRFGMIARYGDDHNLTMVEIDGDGIRITDTVRGIARISWIKSEMLRRLSWSTWHKIVVIRAWYSLELRIDGSLVGTVQIAAARGAVGLCATRTEAEFSSLTVTDHVDLWGDSMVYIGNEVHTDGHLQLDKALHTAGSGLSQFTFLQALEGWRYVLDFTTEVEHGKALVLLGPYRLAICRNQIELSREGLQIESLRQPNRFRTRESTVRLDDNGRALTTARLAACEGVLRIHVRNHTWQVPSPLLAHWPCQQGY